MSSTLPIESLAITAEYLAQYEAKEMLRFVTCGSVDDGKSTLIGRLLLETGTIFEDQLTALQVDSQKHGTTDLALDPALLLDGLEDERQQGITIDVAYRYFQTSKRKFIIADSPGHEQYTRNMATAASTADVAIILIDARKGLLNQTRRHSYIVSLLGVRHVIVAVNKMDLVDYEESVFAKICADYLELAPKLEIANLNFVPLSALRGDNVTRFTNKMPWYEGQTLLDYLETVALSHDADACGFRFPVQRVNRPDANFRGYSGTVVSGSACVGDQVLVLPSRKTSRIRSIVTYDGELKQADTDMAVTLTLDDELDVSRGDMLVHREDEPYVSQKLNATIVWMSEQPLVPGKSYWLKQTTRGTSVEVEYVSQRIEVNTLQRVEATSLGLNEIGNCRLSLHDPLAFDSYRRNRRTGAFVMVDRISHETVAAGMILDPRTDRQREDHWEEDLPSPRLQFTPSKIPLQQRSQRFGHEPFTLLLTGLSGAGKTTIAYGLESRLFERGRAVMVLDGQNMRYGISRDLGFSAEERSENLRRAAEIAALINNAGMICIAAFVAPDAAIRQKVRQLIGEKRVRHIHLSAPVEVCRERDLSGRYQAAERGEINNFPGLTAPYDLPHDAELTIPTDRWPLEQCLDEIEQWLYRQGKEPVSGTPPIS